MSQRFAADQALQLLQSIVLESSDGEYSDSKSDELNNVIADIQNSSDSDDKCTGQEVPINTNDGARARNSCDSDEKSLLSKDGSHCGVQFPPKSLQDDISSTILLGSMHDYIIFHIQHHTRQSSFFVRHPFQRAHA